MILERSVNRCHSALLQLVQEKRGYCPVVLGREKTAWWQEYLKMGCPNAWGVTSTERAAWHLSLGKYR